MHITRTDLIRIARETADKAALSDPGLVAAYLTGSLRTANPFLGNAADIDIVFVHEGEPKTRREIIPLTPEIHLDIVHNPRSLYDKPRELRLHPWLGPELYDPLPLYVTHHFFEYIQAGVRDRYLEPSNVQLRSQRMLESARQAWSRLPKSTIGQPVSPKEVLGYLESISLAANAVALLAGEPLAERRFLLQFPARARVAGQPDLAAALAGLIGADRVDGAALAGYLPDWEQSFLASAGNQNVDACIAPARLGYYKLAFTSILASENPQAILWPLFRTWTLAVSALPAPGQAHWRSACATLGLDGGSFASRLEALDHFLDDVDALQERLTASKPL